MECQIKKNEHFQHLIFAFDQGSKVTKAADFFSSDLYQQCI